MSRGKWGDPVRVLEGYRTGARLPGLPRLGIQWETLRAASGLYELVRHYFYLV